MTYSNNNIASYAMGTTFDDNATRNIFDPNHHRDECEFGAGYRRLPVPRRPGHRRNPGRVPRGRAQNHRGDQRHLDARDQRHQPPTSPPSTPNYVLNWSLSFGHGLKADTEVAIPDPMVAGSLDSALGATPLTAVSLPRYAATGLTVPSSPVDIGPGLVMAQDNTLGAYSPYEGRIYAAFVGYINVKVNGFTNPTSNTDIFLTYSDDGGRTWSTPIEVNDDSSDTDGIHRVERDQSRRRGHRQ